MLQTVDEIGFLWILQESSYVCVAFYLSHSIAFVPHFNLSCRPLRMVDSFDSGGFRWKAPYKSSHFTLSIWISSQNLPGADAKKVFQDRGAET